MEKKNISKLSLLLSKKINWSCESIWDWLKRYLLNLTKK